MKKFGLGKLRGQLGLLFMLLTAFRPLVAFSEYNNQMNVMLGYDRPESTAAHGSGAALLRLQLQTSPKRTLRAHTAFGTAFGSAQTMGEFMLGGSAYPLALFYENTRIQPFVGGEGIGAFGSKDNKATLTGGYGLFGGADLRVFGKKAGLTFSLEYTYINQSSLRFWLGLIFLNAT